MMAGLEAMKWYTSDLYSFHGSKADADVDEWLMMSNPAPVILLIAAYLYFVLSFGPKFMVKRDAFDLKYIMIIYNLYQVIFSTWMCCQIFGSDKTISYIFHHSCVPLVRSNNPLIAMMNSSCWWYFMSKIIELLDTVFFVLRKKQNQVTVLHVYHHASMVISTWGYLKYVRGEQAIVPGALNCFVHVVMYSYYLLAALGPGVQKYLWWKKYLTTLQLSQFVLILIYLFTMIVLDCKVPRGLTVYMAMNTLIFLILFLNFYNKSYQARNSKAKLKSSNFVCIQPQQLNGMKNNSLNINKEEMKKEL